MEPNDLYFDNSDHIHVNSSYLDLQFEFKHPIETVWNELRDIPKWKSRISYFTNFEITNNLKPWEPGCQFKFLYKGYVVLIYQTVEVEDEPFYKKIVTKCISNEYTNVLYKFEYNLFYNTSNNTTFLTYHLCYTTEVGSTILEIIEFEKKELFSKNNKFLNDNRKFERLQTESCIIKKNRTKVWNILMDFQNFIKITDGADSIEIKNGIFELDSVIEFKYVQLNISIPFKVVKIEKNKDELNWKLCLGIIDKENN